MNLQLTLPISILLLTACANSLSQDRDPRVEGKTVAVPQGITADPVWQKLGGCNVLGQSYLRTQQCWTLEAAKLPPFDPGKPEQFGELYNPQKFLECKLQDPRNSACDRFALRRPENPEYWPPGSKKITWSQAPKESVYREGMNGREYFAALCQAEAGEFIYKTVDNVEGIYQIRPRAPQESNPELMDRYVMEDPYGHTGWEAAFGQHPSTIFVNPPWNTYQHFERHETAASITGAKHEHARMNGPLSGEGYYRYSGYRAEITLEAAARKQPSFAQHVPQIGQPMQREIIPVPQSRYGFTWRGISRPHDRELGIAGGELAVVDMQTGEMLGLRRGFIYSATKGNKATWWLAGAVCPQLTDRKGRSKDGDFTYWFVSKIAKPSQPSFETQEGENK